MAHYIKKSALASSKSSLTEGIDFSDANTSGVRAQFLVAKMRFLLQLVLRLSLSSISWFSCVVNFFVFLVVVSEDSGEGNIRWTFLVGSAAFNGGRRSAAFCHIM